MSYDPAIPLLDINPAAAAKSLQSCLPLCDPIDGSPPGSPIPGIFQARTLEWVAISFSNAWKWKVKMKLLSRVWLLATSWTAAHHGICQARVLESVAIAFSTGRCKINTLLSMFGGHWLLSCQSFTSWTFFNLEVHGVNCAQLSLAAAFFTSFGISV